MLKPGNISPLDSVYYINWPGIYMGETSVMGMQNVFRSQPVKKHVVCFYVICDASANRHSPKVISECQIQETATGCRSLVLWAP